MNTEDLLQKMTEQPKKRNSKKVEMKPIANEVETKIIEQAQAQENAVAVAEVKPKRQSKAKVQAQAQANAEAEAESEAQPEANVEPKPKRQTKAKVKAQAEAQDEVQVEPKAKPKRQTKAKVVDAPMDTTAQLEQIIMSEMKADEEIRKMVAENMKNPDNDVLAHLGQYIEEPFKIIESYFNGRHSSCLVRHQLESYNDCIHRQIPQTIQMFNPVMIRSDKDILPDTDKYSLEIEITFTNLKLYPPQIYENNGATKLMMPNEAKLRMLPTLPI